MSRSADPRPIHVKYREELKLAAAFLGTFVPALFVASMLARAVDESQLSDDIGSVTSQAGISEPTLGTLILGFVLALITLLLLDYQKRVQGILLGIAYVVGVGVIFSQLGVATSLGAPEAVMFLGGFLVGFVGIGREKLQYIQVGDTSGAAGGRSIEARGQDPLRFPLAEKTLFAFLGVLLIIGFFEAHTTYDQFLGFENLEFVDMTPRIVTFDIVSSSILFGSMYWFLGYESNRSVFVLGPSGSGKTHLSIGMYLKAQEMGYRPRNTTDELTRLVQRIIDEENFIPERTREVQDLSFEFTAGKYFPKNVKLDAFDYPGEYLPHVPGGLEVFYGVRSEYDYEDEIREQVDEGVAVDQGKGLSAGSEETDAVTDGGSVESEESAEQSETDNIQTEQVGTQTSEDEVADADTTAADEEPMAAIDVGDEVIRERAKLMTNEVCPRVADADLLVLVIDIERFLNDVPLGTEWYSNILARLPDDQETIIVATKADLMLSEGEGGSMQDMINPARLRDNVDQSLRNHAGASRLPIAEKPYPVFYKTYEENGERHIQMQSQMNPGGQQRQNSMRKWPSLYGYEALLSRLGR